MPGSSNQTDGSTRCQLSSPPGPVGIHWLLELPSAIQCARVRTIERTNTLFGRRTRGEFGKARQVDSFFLRCAISLLDASIQLQRPIAASQGDSHPSEPLTCGDGSSRQHGACLNRDVLIFFAGLQSNQCERWMTSRISWKQRRTVRSDTSISRAISSCVKPATRSRRT